MLEGINYYPKKKKRLRGKLLWFLLFFLIFSGVWYYFQDIEIGENKSSSIIISQPKNFEEKIETVVDNIEQPISSPILEKETEKLDEVITKLDDVDEKLETIDTKISEGFDDLSDLIKSSNHLENPTSAKDFIVNAYIYKNRGELLESQKSFEEYFRISKKYEIDVMLDYSKVLEKNQGYSALKMFYKQLEQLEDESVIVAEMLSTSNGDLDLLEQLWNKNLNTPIYKWALLTLRVGTVFEMGQNGQSMELQKKLITQSLEFHKELGCDFKNIQQYFLNSSSAKDLVFSNSINKSPGYYNWAVPVYLDQKGLLLKTELTKLGCYRY